MQNIDFHENFHLEINDTLHVYFSIIELSESSEIPDKIQ